VKVSAASILKDVELITLKYINVLVTIMLSQSKCHIAVAVYFDEVMSAYPE
jgi:hypothetical protein